MKTKIKLIVIGVVVLAMAAAFFLKRVILKDETEVTPPVNQFTESLQNDIEQIVNLSSSNLDFSTFNNIAYKINDFHSKNKFSNISADNDQWKQILDANLFSAFAQKHIEQVQQYFSNSTWNSQECVKIKSFESGTLLKSPNCVQGSSRDQELKAIIATIDLFLAMEHYAKSHIRFKYNENVLNDCKKEIQINDQKRSEVVNHIYLKNNTTLIADLDKREEKVKEEFFIVVRRQFNYVDKEGNFSEQSELRGVLNGAIESGLFSGNATDQFKEWMTYLY